MPSTRASRLATLMPALTAAVSAAVVLTAGPATAQSRAVDLDRFDGRWFEIARNPNDVQKDCRRAQIDFTPQSRADRYGLLVTCTRRADGGVETLRANARVTDTATNAKFRFTLGPCPRLQLGHHGPAGQVGLVDLEPQPEPVRGHPPPAAGPGRGPGL